MNYLIGIDLGGTTINIGALSAEGKVMEEHMLNTDPASGPEKAITRIINTFNELETTFHAKPMNKNLVVGLPGIFDQKNGKIVQAANLPGWEGYPFREALSTALNMPVIVKNDADLAALGETWVGSGKSFNDAFMITLGSGVGGAMIVNKKLLEINNISGEFGHMVVNLDGVLCSCGRRGCVETYFSRYGLLQLTKNHLQKGKTTKLSSYPEENITPLLLATLAKEKDTVAMEIIKEGIYGLATGMANISNTLGITNFIIGGGISNAWDVFEKILKESLTEQVFDAEDRNINVVKANLEVKAGIIGSAKFALDIANK